MITEDYVSFETAKLLKEKGFDIQGYASIKVFGGNTYKVNGEWINAKEDTIIPTTQMAMKWLREVHKIIPIILTGEYTQKPLYYWFRIDAIIEERLKDAIYREDEKEFSSYEEACEAAIKYCIKNLI